MPSKMYIARFTVKGDKTKHVCFTVWFSALRQLERSLLRRMARYELSRLIGVDSAIDARLETLKETETEVCE